MSKRRKIISLILAVLVITSGVAVAIYLKTSPFRAEGELPTAGLSVKIVLDSEAANGWLYISGDCADSPAPAINGRYYCKLTTTDQNVTNLQVTNLSYFDFDREQTYYIPLTITRIPEGSSLTLGTNENLILDVAIDSSANKLTARRLNEATHEYEPFPPENP